MKRIFIIIVPLMFITALVGYLFGFGDYNLVRQLLKISEINYPSPINEYNNLVNRLQDLFYNNDFSFVSPVFADVHDITDFFKNVGSFFSYLGSWISTIATIISVFFKSIWEVIQFIVLSLWDVLIDIYLLLVSFLVLMGFPLDLFFNFL